MICRKCHTNNPESAVYCESCGIPLIRKPNIKKFALPWYVLIAFLVILMVGAYFIYRITKKTPGEDLSSDPGARKTVLAKALPISSKNRLLTTGGVVVKDLEGREISSWASTVFNETWIAAPVWSLLGGNDLVFETAGSEEISIKKGVWTSGSPIMLLKLQVESSGKTPELVPWKQYKPLEWRPYLQDSGFRLDIPTPQRRGTFLSFRLPFEVQEAGVFMQEGHIVGWAFPDWLDNGYLWAGPIGADLSPDIQVDEFLRSTLADWRETQLDDVLNRGESIPPIRRLEIFAAGLGMDSRFADEDVPENLKPESIVNQMHSLASDLIDSGSAKEVARILDEQVIIGSGEITLLKDSISARVESEDYNRALQFMERIKKGINEKEGQGISGFEQFHAKLYKDWLRKILDQGGYYSGMMAFEEAKRHFPGDVEIHLLGVEMALTEKNWARARELLRMRDYPENMREWVGELENEIQEVQETENAITIRFNPGSKHIPVRVYLNGTHSFQFILDTGATLCSIPSSAVDRLRINIDQTTPIRLISTAGGFAETYEVKLKSVELEGFRVLNVEALIIDIPGFRDYGLLGQNFLNNFHIEIDSQKGILRLKKR